MKQLLCALIFVFTSPLILFSQVPRTMSYQGVLSDEEGMPLPDGLYQMTFRLYEESMGGAAVWAEDQEVSITGGLFHVNLGSESPLDIPFDRPYWLETDLDGETLSPRSALNSSPYSLGGMATGLDASSLVNLQEGLAIPINENDEDIHLVAFQDAVYVGKDTSQFNKSRQDRRPINLNGSDLQMILGNLTVDADRSRLRGQNGLPAVAIIANSSAQNAIRANSGTADAIQSTSISGKGINSSSSSNTGVSGSSESGIGVEGHSNASTGVMGESAGGVGVHGKSNANVGVRGESLSSSGISGTSNSANGVHGMSATASGVFGESSSGEGVTGISSSGVGVAGTSEDREGVLGESETGNGVTGQSSSAAGVYGFSMTGNGVEGISVDNVGIFARSTNDLGVYAESTGSTAIAGESKGAYSYGVAGYNEDWGGVFGESKNGDGVTGYSISGTGVYAYSQDEIGIHARGKETAAILEGNVLIQRNGELYIDKVDDSSSDQLLVWGSNKFVEKRSLTDITDEVAFDGILIGHDFAVQQGNGNNVFEVNNANQTATMAGLLCADEIKVDGLCVFNFLEVKDDYGTPILDIDPNADPYSEYAVIIDGNVMINGYLESYKRRALKMSIPQSDHSITHYGIQSDQVKNSYDGNTILDANGEAEVSLPTWFEDLNSDFRYQLTCIGGYANVYIAKEISGNTFRIAGGTPGMKVSWEVTGTSIDADVLTQKPELDRRQ